MTTDKRRKAAPTGEHQCAGTVRGTSTRCERPCMKGSSFCFQHWEHHPNDPPKDEWNLTPAEDLAIAGCSDEEIQRVIEAQSKDPISG